MPDRLDDYASIRQEIVEASAEVRSLLDKTQAKRRIALMLTRMRAKRDFSQKDIAERIGWDKAFVSRLESAQGGVPDMQTLSRYAGACGLSIGLVVCDAQDITEEATTFEIVDALPLPLPEGADPKSESSAMLPPRPALEFDNLRGRLIHDADCVGDTN
jgi:transcriptional regulator with XRE-family HTH domain